MPANDLTGAAIDRAYEWHIRTLFQLAAKQIEGNHVADARVTIRKQLAAAQQTRAEMQLIANESLCP